MGMSSYNVISVLEGHAPQELTADKNKMLEEAFLLPYPKTWEQLLEEYGARRVLVPKVYACRDVTLLLNGVRLQATDLYDLYEVDPAGSGHRGAGRVTRSGTNGVFRAQRFYQVRSLG